MQLVFYSTQQPHRINIDKYRKSKSFMIAHMQFRFHLCANVAIQTRYVYAALLRLNRTSSIELCAFAWVIIYEE